MGKILQILIIENRDLAHAQTFCTRAWYKLKKFSAVQFLGNPGHRQPRLRKHDGRILPHVSME